MTNQEIFYGPLEVVNNKDLTLLDKFVDSDCIIHSGADITKGIDSLRRMIELQITAFPDLHISVQEGSELSSGDMITHHAIFSGTNTGRYKDNPPTGNSVSWVVGRTARIKNGKIAELWIDSDRLSMLEQINVIEEKVKK